MRRYTMQDRSSPEKAESTTKSGLSLSQALYVTDYSEEEVDQGASLQVGEHLLLGSDKDIFIERTE